MKDCRGTGTVTPDIIYNLSENINANILKEVTILEAGAKAIHTGAIAANKVSASGAQVTYKLVIDYFKGEINQFIENMTKLEATIVTDIDTKAIAQATVGLTFLVAFIIFSLIACFATIMCSLFNPKCSARMKVSCSCCLRWNKFMLGGLSLVKVCCGMLCLVTGLLVLTVVFILANAFHLSYKIINDRELASKVVNDTDTFRYLNLCLFTDSTGDLGELLPITHRSSFKDLSNMFNGINVDYSSMNLSETTVPSLEKYKTKIDSYINWGAPDFTNPSISASASAPYQGVKEANSILNCLPKSGEQQISLSSNDCKTSLQKSTLTDLEPYRNTQPYCLIPSKFSWTELPTRYSSINPAVSCASAVSGIYKPLKACVDSHDTKLKNFKTSFESEISNKAEALKASIKTSKENSPGWGDHFEKNNILVESRAFLKGEKLT